MGLHYHKSQFSSMEAKSCPDSHLTCLRVSNLICRSHNASNHQCWCTPFRTSRVESYLFDATESIKGTEQLIYIETEYCRVLCGSTQHDYSLEEIYHVLYSHWSMPYWNPLGNRLSTLILLKQTSLDGNMNDQPGFCIERNPPELNHGLSPSD